MHMICICRYHDAYMYTLKNKNSNLYGLEIHRSSIKSAQLLFQVIKKEIVIRWN